MAIVYSYPKVTSPLATDVLVLTDTTLNAGKRKNKTKSIAMSDVATYVINSKSGITGSGTINKLPIFTASTVVGDSQLEQAGPSSSGLYQIRFNNADRFIINKPSSATSGDPEYLIQQDGNFKVSFGWDDDGDGYGYIYNWAGKGLRLGAAGQNPQFELNTVTPEIISHTAHLFDGTAQFEANIKVNAALEDHLGNTGTAGQVLTSTGTGVAWATDAGGSVTGTGTTNYIAKWNTSSSIQNSLIFDNGISVGIGTTSPQAKLHINSQQPLFVTDGNEVSLSIDAGNYIYSIGDISGGENQSYMQIESAASKAFFLNSNVGIGTTSPDRLLSLYSNNTETTPRFLIEQDGTGDAVMAFSLTGVQGWSMGIDNSLSNSFMIHNSAGGVDSSSQFTINTSGNIGIGTVSPVSTLDISKDTASLLNLHRPNSSTAASSFLDFSFNTANGTEAVYSRIRSDVDTSTDSAQNGSLSFYNASSGSIVERMRITSAGNVGIGTTSPNAKLQVSGVTGTSIIQALGVDSNGFADLEVKSTGTAGSSRLFFSDTAAKSGYIRYSHSSNSMEFATNSGERMRITSTGNVGIGTANPGLNPTTKLAVADNGGAGLEIIPQTSNDRTTLLSYDRNSTAYQTMDFDGSDIHFNISGSEKMRITSSGNVGIDVTNPHTKLTINDSNVSGQSQLAIGDTSSYYLAIGHNSTGATDGFIGTVYNNDAARFDIRMKGTAQSDAKVTVLGTGNVGIGTTNPGFALEVNSSSTSGVMSVKNSSNGRDTFRSENAAGTRTVNIGNDANGHGLLLLRGAGGTTTSYLTGSGNSYLNGGNVGIGTTSPDRQLQVSGAGTTVAIKVKATDGSQSSLDLENTEGWFRIINDGGSLSVYDQSDSAERFRINTSGNVGIGTASPASKLEVDGGDIEVDDSASGLILRSPNGTRYRIKVDNSGNLTTTAV